MSAPLSPREPIHPAEPALPPGPTLAWRQRRRLAAGCRAWGKIAPSQGGDPRHVVAADCLEDERDLVAAFAPLASWFRMDPARVGSWSTEAMLDRVAGIRAGWDAGDPYAVLHPTWAEIPVGRRPTDAVYIALLADGPTEIRLFREQATGDLLPGLTWRRGEESGVVPVRSRWPRQRADRIAWWDWLYLRTVHLACQQDRRRVPLPALNYLILPGLPWRTA